MYLPGNLHKSQRRIQMVADGILGEGFNFGVRQARSAKVGEGVFE